MDVDEATVKSRKNEVHKFINDNKLSLSSAELIVITQNRCIETWFLGNKKIFKNNPQSDELASYVKFYNVKENDP